MTISVIDANTNLVVKNVTVGMHPDSVAVIKMDELDTTPPSSTFLEPQFAFGLILMFAWLIFMAVVLSLYHGDMNTAITAMERIPALFTAALGFVWGFYFGTKNSQQVIKQLLSRIRDLEKISR